MLGLGLVAAPSLVLACPSSAFRPKPTLFWSDSVVPYDVPNQDVCIEGKHRYEWCDSGRWDLIECPHGFRTPVHGNADIPRIAEIPVRGKEAAAFDTSGRVARPVVFSDIPIPVRLGVVKRIHVFFGSGAPPCRRQECPRSFLRRPFEPVGCCRLHSPVQQP